MSAHELHPVAFEGDPQVFVTELQHAVGLHEAAASLTLVRNRQRETESLSPEQQAARKNILDIAIKLTIAERNKALDDFCLAWQKFRQRGG